MVAAITSYVLVAAATAITNVAVYNVTATINIVSGDINAITNVAVHNITATINVVFW